jgi:8-oxo-dGTP pyrophosphatase MutT (NUDIX family)
LRQDQVEWPDGAGAEQTVFEGPAAAVIVPVFDDATTLLVRQWRHAWELSSWEAPAGTLAEGEEPMAAARRELREETGLEASRWTPLGVARGSAISTVRFHIFMAQGLRRGERRPEPSERDMIVRGLPLRQAVDEALGGGIVHAGSITALCRAARALGLI